MGQLFLSAILLLLIYMPGVYLRPGLPALHLEDPMIGFGAIALVLFGQHRPGRLLMSDGMNKLMTPYLLLLAWVFLISIIFAMMRANTVVVSAAFFKILSMTRPLFYSMLFMAVMSVNGYRRIGKIVGLLVFIFVIQMGIMYCQRYQLFGVNSWLTPRFNLLGTTSIYSRVGLRSDGTFGNPNDAAVAMMVFGIMCYAYLAFGTHMWRRVASGVLAALCLGVTLAIAKSRAGAGGLVAGFFIIHSVAIFMGKRRSTGVLLTVLLLVGMMLTWLTIAGSALGERFAVLFGQQSLTEEGSFAARMYVWWNRAFANMGPYIVTGRGLGDYIMAGFFDSGYVAYFFTGGMMFIVMFLIMMIAPIRFFWRYLKQQPYVTERSYLYVAAIAVCGASLVVTVSHPVLYADKLWLIYLTALGLAFAQVRLETEAAEAYELEAMQEYWPAEEASWAMSQQ